MRRIIWNGAIASAVLTSACATASPPQTTTAHVESREETGAATDPEAAQYLPAARQQVAEGERLMHDPRETTAQPEAFATLHGFASVNENDERGIVITMSAETMFRSGSSKLLPRAKEHLDEVASALQKLGDGQTFVIESHTDSRGSPELNRRLSKQRADAVRFYLIEQGVSRDRIIARGRGEDDPVASNANPEGRANNRRVELVVSPSVVGGL